jgi:hypothetical protein
VTEQFEQRGHERHPDEERAGEDAERERQPDRRRAAGAAHRLGGLLLRQHPGRPDRPGHEPAGAAGNHPSPAARSFDIPGVATLSGALFLLIFGLIKGPDYGWTSAPTLAFLGAAALAGLLFALRESRTRQPLLPLKLFRSASLSAGVVLVILLMFAMFGAMFFMTFYLENVHGLDPISAGVHLLPMTAMLIIGSPIAGALISKLGPRIPLVAGMQLGGALDTAVLGAIMSAKIATTLPASWHAPSPAPSSR